MPLISPRDLAAHLHDPKWFVVDCRFDLSDPLAGRKAYAAGHIPGAIYADLERDLSSVVTPASGRHPLPEANAFAATLRRWGVGADMNVVAYDADTGAFAARLWWLLRWIGVPNAYVLNGGWRAWTQAGLPATPGEPAPRIATRMQARPDDTMWVDAATVERLVRHPDWRVLDARAPERYLGRVEPIDPVAGHIPGAINHPFGRNLAVSGEFLPPDELRAAYHQSQDGVSNEHTIVMCGSGVTACHLLLAMEVAGKPGAKLYAGSWSEWIKDPNRPIARDV